MTDDWPAEIVVVNESRDQATPGDVSVFRTADEACGWLEPWWVENGEGFAFTTAGERLMLGVDDCDRVIVTGREETSDGARLVYGWLRAAAAAVLEARRVKSALGKIVLSRSEEQGELPTSIEGLVAYIGFNG
jgi:hypothetical protein